MECPKVRCRIAETKHNEEKKNFSSSKSLDKKKIKRPPNSFLIFSKERRPQLLESNPLLSNKAASKILGEEWRALTKEEQRIYYIRAEAEKTAHKQQYPDYRYSPIEARERKALQRKRREDAFIRAGGKRIKREPSEEDADYQPSSIGKELENEKIASSLDQYVPNYEAGLIEEPKLPYYTVPHFPGNRTACSATSNLMEPVNYNKCNLCNVACYPYNNSRRTFCFKERFEDPNYNPSPFIYFDRLGASSYANPSFTYHPHFNTQSYDKGNSFEKTPAAPSYQQEQFFREQERPITNCAYQENEAEATEKECQEEVNERENSFKKYQAASSYRSDRLGVSYYANPYFPYHSHFNTQICARIPFEKTEAATSYQQKQFMYREQDSSVANCAGQENDAEIIDIECQEEVNEAEYPAEYPVKKHQAGVSYQSNRLGMSYYENPYVTYHPHFKTQSYARGSPFEKTQAATSYQQEKFIFREQDRPVANYAHHENEAEVTDKQCQKQVNERENISKKDQAAISYQPDNLGEPYYTNASFIYRPHFNAQSYARGNTFEKTQAATSYQQEQFIFREQDRPVARYAHQENEAEMTEKQYQEQVNERENTFKKPQAAASCQKEQFIFQEQSHTQEQDIPVASSHQGNEAEVTEKVSLEPEMEKNISNTERHQDTLALHLQSFVQQLRK